MNCLEFRKFANSWIEAKGQDSRLSDGLRNHQRMCTECSEWVSEFQEVDNLVLQNAVVYDPSPFIWTRVQVHVQAQETQSIPTRVAIWSGTSNFVRWIWAGGRQVAAGICLLVLLATTFLVHQQADIVYRQQSLGHIDNRWSEFRMTLGDENPFTADIRPNENANPFVVLPSAGEIKDNPFDLVKS